MDSGYAYDGWYSGEGDCEPPEPGKEWLTITHLGEEIATIVLRKTGIEGRDTALRIVKEGDAKLIVTALNLAHAVHEVERRSK